MGKLPLNPEAWIDLEDYLFRNVRRDKLLPISPAVQSLPPATDETWVELKDYLIHGVRRVKSIDPKKFLEPAAPHSSPSMPHPPGTQRPPEANHTIYSALEEVLKVHNPRGPVMQAIDDLQGTLVERVAAGELDPEQAEQQRQTLEQVRENHTARAEEINAWYLDHHFRVFEDKVEKPSKPDLATLDMVFPKSIQALMAKP
ncbi:MAG: hypothetical protein HQL53_10325 [Magnetococcales bacterium]|nr:hypothetical protein [Magnetococcales bacterium]